MKLAASLSKLFAALRVADTRTRIEGAAIPTPLIVALEPRIVYDASAVAIGAAAAPHHHQAHAETHAGADASNPPAAASSVAASANAPAATAGRSTTAQGPVFAAPHGDPITPGTGSETDTATNRIVHGYTDVARTAQDQQVVFINSNVTDYQTLVAGLPQGTQYVILDSTKDGLAQIEQYLQQHPGVSAIHLVSHGSDGNVQIGSTWLNEADLSAYSGELAQIGAAMKPGGDFLIYGCDVAENADGKALVQQIASITGLNVAASTDATGAASLGGDWTLEYDVGNVHTGVIFSAAAEQNFDHVLAVIDENYDSQVGFDTGATAVVSTTLDGLTYTGDQAVEYAVVPGSLPASASGGELIVNIQSTPMSTLTIQRQDGSSMAVQSFDIDIFTSNDVKVEALDSSGNVLGTIDLNINDGSLTHSYDAGHLSGSSLFHVDLSGIAAFSQVKSIKLVESSGNGTYLSPTLDNFIYIDPSSPPMLTASVGNASFVAADNATSSPVVVDPGITLTDGDSATATSATVSITGNFHIGEDLLSFQNTNSTTYGNIGASYNASTGVLTLTSSGGTASITQWQAALRAVTYTDTLVTPAIASRTVSFAITSDGFTPGNTVQRTVTVADTDQTPIVTTTGHTTTYSDGGSAVTIDSGVTVSDLDSPTQSSGTVTVSGGFHSGDTLSFTNDGSTMGNIAVSSYNSATGVLTLTSAGALATDAQWQQALSAVMFSSTSTTYGNRTISFTTNDGAKTSVAATDIVNVATPLQITTDSGSAAFVAGDNTASTPVAVDSGLTVSDLATGTLSTATVAISGGFRMGEDVLSFTNDGSTMGNITASYNSSTGVLTLTSSSASATLAQWQSALQSVTYTDTAVTPGNVARTVSFTAVDSLGNTSSTVTRSVTVTDTDQTPIVTTTGGTTNYVGGTSAATIDSGVSISDLDNATQASGTVSVSAGFHSGDTLSFTNTNSTTFGNIAGFYNAATGVLTLTSSGDLATDAQWSNALSAVTFSAGSSATPGNRTISFTVNDGFKTSAVGTDTVDVLGPPTITTDSGSAAFVAGDNVISAPVAIDSGLTLTDGGAPTLGQATVAITGNFHSGEDVLLFTNDGSTMGNIAASYNASTGVLTLTSSSASATLAQWQSALQSVMYTDTAITPAIATRTISFTATDSGAVTSNTATRTVTVADTDQTPIITTTGGTTNYVGGTSAATIDSGITVSDLDSTTQSTGTVSITSGFHSGDTLSFTNTNSPTFGNIIGSYNPATGVLTLTSSGDTASDAQWSNALRAVTFSAGSSTTPGNRTISFTVNDGIKTSAVRTDTVDVLGPPTITADSGSAAFVAGDNVVSTPVAIDSGLTLTDGSASTLAQATVAITGNFHSGEDVLGFTNTSTATFGNIAASYNAATGVLTLTSSGASATLAQWQSALQSVTYTDTAITPNNATRTISFTATDSSAFTSNTATRTVTVTDTDQTPIVATTGGTTNYVDGTSAATIDQGITVVDLDNTTQSTGIVSITSGFHSGDTLSFTNTNSPTFGNIVGSYNAATGVLTLTSSGDTASDTQWSNALRAVTFSAGSSATPGNRTISFTVNDGFKTSAVGTDTVDVLGRPTITTDSGAASFVAGDNVSSTPVTIDSGLTLTDGSAPTLAQATVAITGNFHSGEDVLGFTNTSAATFGNIAASYNASTGVLTLTSSGASATLAQWQSALRSITYTDTAVTPNNVARTVSFTVVDRNGAASDVQTRAVTVTDTDQTPTLAVSGSVTFTSQQIDAVPVSVAPQVSVGDRDANAALTSAQVAISGGFDPLHDQLSLAGGSAASGFAGSYNASTGVLTLTWTGATKASLTQWQSALEAVTYSNSAPRASGSRTVTLTISDGVKTSVAATNTITIVTGRSGGTPTSALPTTSPASPGGPSTPGSSPSPAGSDNTGAPAVLDEFGAAQPVGSVPVVPTMTFSDPNAPAGDISIDHATVSRFDAPALDATLAVTPVSDLPSLLSDLAVEVPQSDPFSIDVATLLPSSAASQGRAFDVTVQMANGRSLPGWIHYDAASGVLRGTVPPGVADARIVIDARDAAGHVIHRDVVLMPHPQGAGHHVAHPRAPAQPQPHPDAGAHGHAARDLAPPLAARAVHPVGKPSLDQQFAQARAALHVARPAGPVRRV